MIVEGRSRVCGVATVARDRQTITRLRSTSGCLVFMAIYESENQIKWLFSHTKFPNWIATSARGTGKSFAVEDFLKDKVRAGKYFTFIRESQTEVDEALKGGFWDAEMLERDPWARAQKWTVKSNFLLCNDIIVASAVALTTYSNLRQSGKAYGSAKYASKARRLELEEQVNNVERMARSSRNLLYAFFDEFEPLQPKMTAHERVKSYKHACENIFRMRTGVHAILCANLETPASPFLDAFNFPTNAINYGTLKSYTRDERHKPLAVWTHIRPNAEWQEARKNSYVGLMNAGHSEDEIFTTGMPTALSNVIVSKFSGDKKLWFCVISKFGVLTVWKIYDGNIYITAGQASYTARKYVVGERLISGDAREIPTVYADMLVNAWRHSTVVFDKHITFETFAKIFKLKE